MPGRTVLLTGASGLLGTWLGRTAPAGVRMVGVVHRTPVPGESVVADLRDRAAVSAAVEGVRPDLVIHAAYAVDEVSIVDATRHVVEAAERAGAALLHVSTDAVFAGLDDTARTERDRPDPVSDYGRWKWQAERIVTDSADRSTIVRLPLLVSLDPDDHVVIRIREGAARGEPTTWFDDEFRQPAATQDVARALWRIVSLGPDERAGVWHLPGPETLSRHEIAQRVVAALGLPPDAIRAGNVPPSMTRPRCLALADDRARDRIAWAPTEVLRRPGT